MDYKDFKKYLQQQVKKTLSDSLSSYSAKLRNSRPRAKDNIINPKQKGIWTVLCVSTRLKKLLLEFYYLLSANGKINYGEFYMQDQDAIASV